MSATPQRCRRAFTLVELLVVVGIIALLIAILLPVLSRAREAADTVKCLSNLRQIAVANSMYVAQWNGWAVPGVMGPPSTGRAIWQNNNGWRRNINLPEAEPNPKEVGLSQAPDGLLCPAAVTARDRGRLNNSYGYNIRHVNYVPKPLIVTLPAASDWNPITTEFAGVKAIRVRNPAEKIQFIDAMTPFVEPQMSNHYARIDQYQEYGQPPGTVNASRVIALPAYRHGRDQKSNNARINIAFWDGHAATMHRGDVAAVKTPHDPPDVDGPVANRTQAWYRHWELGVY
jgi:prepilin-type N-terminal cleavage/methylation domain-containing protein/prepilin-type processing-associated H-X9-DG protein